jgi:hypothetical protein
MKAPVKPPALLPPLPLIQGERTEVRGSKNASQSKATNPHPTLSLEKGEADRHTYVSKAAVKAVTE